MSSYEYSDALQHLLILSGSCMDEAVILTVADDATAAGLTIPNADVPTVVAELLKAAGQEATILPKVDAPRYEVRGNYLHFQRPDGKEHAIGLYESAEDLTRVAHYNLVAAEYIENKATREADAKKKLQERRDALAREFTVSGLPYSRVGNIAQNAINRIIELEDGK